MKPDEKQLFETFWDHVRRMEADIAVNWHKGCPPPDPLGVDWDEDFATAYEAIKPFFRYLRKEQVFVPPLGMTWRATPMTTETAHQALMWFLNPPKEVYGHPGVLDTPEYLAIKAAAMGERRLRAEAKEKAVKKPKVSRDSTKDKLRILFPFLLHHHKKNEREPLTATQISEQLTTLVGAGWSQPSVSRAMEKLYPDGGMEEYRELCISGAILKKGILKRYEDGTFDVDAVVNDD